MSDNEEYFLRVDRYDDEETVSICGNKKGLEYLRDCLNSLLDSRRTVFPEDISLMMPSWGGVGLSEAQDAPASKGIIKIDHLRLYRWN